jgi:hypothetical protein
MKWEKFFKPDWRKILIFVILFLLITFLPILLGFCATIPTVVGDKQCLLVIQPFFVFLPSETISYKPIVTGLYFVPSLYWILDIIFWYLLSCLIVWIYDKVKKK